MKAWSKQFQVLLSGPRPSRERGWTRSGLSPEILLLLLLLSRRRSSHTIHQSQVFPPSYGSHRGEANASPASGGAGSLSGTRPVPRRDTGSQDAPAESGRSQPDHADNASGTKAKTSQGSPQEGQEGRIPGTPVLGDAEEEPTAHREAFVIMEQHLSLRRGWELLLRQSWREAGPNTSAKHLFLLFPARNQNLYQKQLR